MTQLDYDLEHLKDEAFSKKDVKAAIALITEICGFGAALYFAAVVVSALFGPGGLIPMSTGFCIFCIKQCGEVYGNLSVGQRALVRKIIRAINGIVR